MRALRPRFHATSGFFLNRRIVPGHLYHFFIEILYDCVYHFKPLLVLVIFVLRAGIGCGSCSRSWNRSIWWDRIILKITD